MNYGGTLKITKNKQEQQPQQLDNSKAKERHDLNGDPKTINTKNISVKLTNDSFNLNILIYTRPKNNISSRTKTLVINDINLTDPVKINEVLSTLNNSLDVISCLSKGPVIISNEDVLSLNKKFPEMFI